MEELAKSETDVIREALEFLGNTYDRRLKMTHATVAEKEMARIKLVLISEAQRKMGFRISIWEERTNG